MNFPNNSSCSRRLIASVIVYFIASLASFAIHASDTLSVRYADPTDLNNPALLKHIQSPGGIPLAEQLLDELFKTDKPVVLQMGALEGPLYDPAINEIWIPYSFIEEIPQRFTNAGLNEDDEHAIQITLDVLMHTLFHEVGHALVALYELPILGREECISEYALLSDTWHEVLAPYLANPPD